GDPLHPVHAGLVLQPGVGALAPDLEHDLLEPTELRGRRGQYVAPPCVALCVASIQLEQLTGPERRLLPAGAGADLDHDVLRVVGVLRNEQGLEPRAQGLRAGVGRLSLLAKERRHLGVRFGGREVARLLRLPTGLAVVAVGRDDLLELGELLAEPAHPVAVRGDLGRGHLIRELLVPCLDLGQTGVEIHRPRLSRTARRASRPGQRRGYSPSSSSSQPRSSGGMSGIVRSTASVSDQRSSTRRRASPGRSPCAAPWAVPTLGDPGSAFTRSASDRPSRPGTATDSAPGSIWVRFTVWWRSIALPSSRAAVRRRSCMLVICASGAVRRRSSPAVVRSAASRASRRAPSADSRASSALDCASSRIRSASVRASRRTRSASS